MKRTLRFLFVALCIMTLGAAGSVLLSRVLLPYLAKQPAFYNSNFLQSFVSDVTVVRPIEQVVIKESGALTVRTLKGASSFLGEVILRNHADGIVIRRATGMFVAADGGFLTHAQAVLEKGTLEVVRGENRFSARLLRVDAVSGLALLKVEGSEFPVASFSESATLEAGADIFMLWLEQDAADVSLKDVAEAAGASAPSALFFNPLFVRKESPSALSLDALGGLSEPHREADGGALVAADGKFLGMLAVDSAGEWRMISARVMRDFLDQAN